jgi:hypothetical protein
LFTGGCISRRHEEGSVFPAFSAARLKQPFAVTNSFDLYFLSLQQNAPISKSILPGPMAILRQVTNNACRRVGKRERSGMNAGPGMATPVPPNEANCPVAGYVCPEIDTCVRK